MSTELTAEPPATPTTTATPRVLAVVVTHDGAEWVLGALRTLSAQRYPAIDVIAVDNGSTDGTADMLRARLGEDRLIALPRNEGFGRAVAAAVRSDLGQQADYVLLVHDDMALMPDAVQWLVGAMEADHSLAIVGPKLREWEEEPLLQQVGMATNALGRADSGLDRGELDQGQHDHRGDVLYVSTAGMLLRRDVFTTVGGFDARYDAFRDDLDLCWRVWVSGRRVGVVTEAVAYHVSAAANGARAGAIRTLADARYRIERHTIATLLKCYSTARLLWVLPVLLLTSLLRVVGMLLSRRVGEAWAVVKALAWNVVQLPQTLRRRRRVQRSRRLPDRRLRRLFAAPGAGLRSQVEGLFDLVGGPGSRALVDSDTPPTEPADPSAESPGLRLLRERAVAIVGVPLLLALLASVAGFYGPGPIIGGEIAAWPDSSLDFLRAYLAPWAGQPLASASFPSPILPLLGVGSLLAAGNAWLASRMLTFGLLAIGWAVALRAGRIITPRPWPRVVGATVYVVSPAVLGALSQGRWSVLVVAVLLPALVSLTIRAADPSTTGGAAWRSTTLLALTVVVIVAAAPLEGLIAPALVAAAALVALIRRWALSWLRLLVAGLSGLAILSPWLLDVLRVGGPRGDALATAGGPRAIVDLPLWRALLGLPQTITDIDGVLGFLLLAIPVSVLLGAVFVGLRARPLVTGGLVFGYVSFAAAAWAAAAFRLPLVWPPALLLPAWMSLAMLAMIVARWSTSTLTGQDFGATQVGTVLAALGLTVGVLASAVLLATGPWAALQHDPQLVPEFIAAEEAIVGDYRVLLLDRDADGLLRWELTGPSGPQMTATGTLRSEGLTARFGEAVAGIAAGVDGDAGAMLGLLNVRYIVLLEPDADLQRRLTAQSDLQPLPSDAAVTYRVRTWLPRAAVVPEALAGPLLATGDPGTAEAMSDSALARVGPVEFRGPVAARGGILVLSEATSALWRATDGRRTLERLELDPVNAFRIPDEDDVRLRLGASGGVRRRAVVTGQMLLVLIVLSLAIRPPGRRQPQVGARPLPSELVGIADVTQAIPRIDPDRPPPGIGP